MKMNEKLFRKQIKDSVLGTLRMVNNANIEVFIDNNETMNCYIETENNSEKQFIVKNILNPYIILGSYSIELFLKYILYKTKGKKVEQRHGLDRIYNEFDDETKEFIESYFKNRIINRPYIRNRIEKIKKKTGEELKYTPQEILKNNSLAFVKVRYFYEEPNKNIKYYYFVGYKELIEALNEWVFQITKKRVIEIKEKSYGYLGFAY